MEPQDADQRASGDGDVAEAPLPPFRSSLPPGGVAPVGSRSPVPSVPPVRSPPFPRGFQPPASGEATDGFAAPAGWPGAGWGPSAPSAGSGAWPPPGDAAPVPPVPPGRRPSRLIRALVVVVIALAAAAVVIPFTVDTPDAASAMNAALTSTLAENSVTVAFGMHLSSGSREATFHGHAQVDLSGGAAALTLTATVAGQSATVHLVAVATTVYVSVPGKIPLPAGKQWVSFTRAKLPSALSTGLSGSPFGTLGALGPLSSPSKVLQVLQQSGATVQTLGPSTVAGTPVNGYRVVITPTVLATLATKAGAPSSAAQSIRSSGIGNVNLTVDVDSAGLVRATQMSMSGTSHGIPFTVSASATFTGYGQPVNVSPPPSTQVVTLFQTQMGTLL